MTETTIQAVRFDYIASNVKGRRAQKLTSNCIAFVGKNRQGKTAYLDTARIAITGKHPVGPHGVDFFELAPEHALILETLLAAHDAAGNEIAKTAFKVEIEKGKPKKPPEKPDRTGFLKDIETLPDAAKTFENMMPTISMRDLIRGSTLTREAVFRRFGEITTLPIPPGLSEAQRALWDEAAKEAESGTDEEEDNGAKKKKTAAKQERDTAEILSGIASHFRRKKGKAGRDIVAIEGLIKEREETLKTAAAGAEELPALREQLKRATAWEGAARLRQRKEEIDTEAAAYQAKVAPYMEADARRQQQEREREEQDKAKRDAIAALQDELQKANERVTKETFFLTGGQWVLECLGLATAKLGKGDPFVGLKQFLPEDPDGTQYKALVELLSHEVEPSTLAPCLICAGPHNPVTVRGEVAPRVAARQASVDKVKEERVAVQRAIDEANRTYEEWKRELANKDRKIEIDKNALRLEHQRIKSAREENKLALESVPTAYEGPTADALDKRIKALESAETIRRNLESEYAKLRQQKTLQQECKTLEDEAARELSSLLINTSTRAEAAVNRYMPAGFVAKLNVDGKDVQWTVIGIDGRGHPKRVMAGSEFGALVPALACAWTEGTPARYVLLDDEDLAFFDPENLALMLARLKELANAGQLTQVFIAWSRPHEIPDDWGQKIYIEMPVPLFASPPAPSLTIVPPAKLAPEVLL